MYVMSEVSFQLLWVDIFVFGIVHGFVNMFPHSGCGFFHPPVDRKCELCNVSDIGDEYHYMLICNYFVIDRKKLIPSQFYINPIVDKFCQLMKSQKKSLLISVAKMCSHF